MYAVSEEIYRQATLLAGSFGLGAWLMFCYDLLRISRLLLPAKTWLISLEDVFYWMYVSASVFSLLYRQNDGILRGYVIAGVVLGMLLYDRIISRNLLKVLQKIMEGIKIRYHKRKWFRKSKE